MEEKAGIKVREVQIRNKLENLTFLIINQWNKLLWEIVTFKLFFVPPVVFKLILLEYQLHTDAIYIK